MECSPFATVIIDICTKTQCIRQLLTFENLLGASLLRTTLLRWTMARESRLLGTATLRFGFSFGYSWHQLLPRWRGQQGTLLYICWMNGWLDKWMLVVWVIITLTRTSGALQVMANIAKTCWQCWNLILIINQIGLARNSWLLWLWSCLQWRRLFIVLLLLLLLSYGSANNIEINLYSLW